MQQEGTTAGPPSAQFDASGVRAPAGPKEWARRAAQASLVLVALLLAACGLQQTATPAGPTPVLTAPRPAVPTPSSARSPVLPTAAPTRPGATSSPLPTPAPATPWPTALPTPTSAPPLRPGTQVATYFFYWYDCPHNHCDSAIVYTVPPGWNEPLPGDPDPADGVYYSSRNLYWYQQELRDMRLAGVEVVLPVSWGESPYAWFRTEALKRLVEANRQMDPPLRIGLFDDTTSEVCEYADFADNREFDYSTYTMQDIPLDLSDPMAGFFFYDRKIKPFFDLIPQEMWATHDGRPLEEGGRPLIVVYTRAQMSHLERAGAVWQAVKDAFRRDFRDRNGQPITPFVILESSWFVPDALIGDPPLAAVIDGRYSWGSALLGPQVNAWSDYTVASVGPGFDDRKNRGSTYRLQTRNRTLDGSKGDGGSFLRSSMAQVPAQTNLLLIETWNELWEGTNVSRAAYPEMTHQPVPEDFYIDVLRQELRGQALWWAAQPLPPTWPGVLAGGQSAELQLAVQNSGARTWSPVNGERLVISGDLLPGGSYEAPLAEPVRPGLVVTFTVVITAPAQAGPHTLTWQMAGPAGPFGSAGTGAIVVGAFTIPVLQVSPPVEPIQAGRPLTLSVELVPPVALAELNMRVRFDPAVFQMAGLWPLPASSPGHWKAKVDNEKGLAFLEAQDAVPGLNRWLALLRLQAVAAGAGEIWIDQVELKLPGGAILVLEPLRVLLTVSPAP